MNLENIFLAIAMSVASLFLLFGLSNLILYYYERNPVGTVISVIVSIIVFITVLKFTSKEVS